MKKCANVFWGLVVCLIFAGSVRAEAIYHEKFYPDGSGPFPAVIALHTSGGFKTVKHLIQRYVDDGFAVYAPNFFVSSDNQVKTANMCSFKHHRDPSVDLSVQIYQYYSGCKLVWSNLFTGLYLTRRYA